MIGKSCKNLIRHICIFLPTARKPRSKTGPKVGGQLFDLRQGGMGKDRRSTSKFHVSQYLFRSFKPQMILVDTFWNFSMEDDKKPSNQTE